MIWRALSVVVYGPATFEGRRRYRRPELAAAAWLLLAGESTVSSLHILRRGRNPAAAVWADTLAAAAIAAIFPLVLGSDREDPWHAWGHSIAPVQAEAVPLALARPPERLAAMAVLCAAPALGHVIHPGPTDWNHIARSAAVTLFRGLWGSLFAHFMRANVARLDVAHHEAVAASRETALQGARRRQRRYLQDRVLSVLDAIAAAERPRDPRLRRAANREAARLRSMLLPNPDDYRAELSDIVERTAANGIDLEVVAGEITAALPPQAVEAIHAEVVAAFDESGTADPVRHVVLFVDTVDGSLVATLRGGNVRREIRFAL